MKKGKHLIKTLYAVWVDLLFSPMPRPHRDWFVLLSLFAVLFVGVGAIGGALFFSDIFDRTDMDHDPTPSRGEFAEINSEDLNTVRDVFEERADLFWEDQERWRRSDPSVGVPPDEAPEEPDGGDE